MAAGETPSSADARAIEEQVARLVASPELSGAARLCAFLEFVVRRTLAGQSEEIKEYVIGTKVFDRPNSFDPRVDTIVRVQASKLRSRLMEYYLTSGANDPIVIELPRGSYVPIFRATTSPAMSGESPATRAETARQWIRRGARAWIIPALAAACLIVLAGIYLLRTRPHTPLQEEGIRFTVLPPENSRFYGLPKISPDGRYLLSIVTDPLGRTALWLRPLAAVSGHVLPGTEGAALTFWSENGRTALFAAAGKRLSQIELARPGPPQTVVLPIMGIGAAFSRDGFLLMAREGAGIARLELTGGALSMLTALDGAHQEISHYWPEFLPDGGHFLYLAHNRNPAEHAIYASSLNGNRRKRLLTSESQAQYAPAGPNASSGLDTCSTSASGRSSLRHLIQSRGSSQATPKPWFRTMSCKYRIARQRFQLPPRAFSSTGRISAKGASSLGSIAQASSSEPLRPPVGAAIQRSHQMESSSRSTSLTDRIGTSGQRMSRPVIPGG